MAPNLILKHLVSLVALKHLQINVFTDTQAILLLGSLSSLITLSLELSFGSVWTDDADPRLVAPVELRRLRDLTLVCSTMSWHTIQEMATRLKMPALESLSLHTAISYFVGSLPALSALIHNRPHLCSLHITINKDNYSFLYVPVRLSEILKTLFPLHTLDDLKVVIDPRRPRVPLSSEDLREAAAAWPHLRRLELYTIVHKLVDSEVPPENAGVGIDILAHFARSCPRLEVLTLYPSVLDVGSLANAESVESDDAEQEGCMAQDTLRELKLGGFIIVRDPEADALLKNVRRYASKLFPSAHVDLKCTVEDDRLREAFP
ncbi:uncharacterized protein BXZ73DRAFT_106734 [Epithele typhae]|uniref:uncharacterized protein n=1 Tax=Epithele typhae TaxID=378194 RepID=UPI002007CB74|nr:uncharacterized protein BXZ73DRAFT_106734 [Epithele typhae]KAH9914086.1 hypothetical protein BXZ73DRAFT_106734 [Epithele typhae]